MAKPIFNDYSSDTPNSNAMKELPKNQPNFKCIGIRSFYKGAIHVTFRAHARPKTPTKMSHSS
jgi:hypothetical protein